MAYTPKDIAHITPELPTSPRFMVKMSGFLAPKMSRRLPKLAELPPSAALSSTIGGRSQHFQLLRNVEGV
jgi:hypothetical protein